MVEKLHRDAKYIEIYEDCKKGSRLHIAQALQWECSRKELKRRGISLLVGRTTHETLITVPAYRGGRGRGYFDKARGKMVHFLRM